MSGSDLEQAVDGFRRAEAALAAITDDARKLATTSAELEDARAAMAAAGEDLKVVAGALVGLATARRELVAQLGTAATALGRHEPAALDPVAAEGAVVPASEEVVIAALHRAADVLDRTAQVGEILPAIEALSAQVASLDILTAQMTALEGLGERLVVLDAMAERLGALGGIGTSLQGIAERLDEVGSAEQLDEVEQRLVSSQRRIYELVLAEGLAFLVLAAAIAYLAAR